jgi:hypothetical protein
MSCNAIVRAVVCIGSLLGALQLWSQSPPNQALNEHLPNGSMRDKAVTACTECHEARIIVQQRLSKAAWTKEVDKMVKWGALVEANDRDALIDYLSGNFGPDQPPYVPPRSSQQKREKIMPSH